MHSQSCPFSDQLSYQDTLLLTCLKLQGQRTFSDFMRFDERNASLLKTLASDEQIRRELEPSLEALMQEIDRLDQKLILTTELFADLVRRELVVPEPRPFRLSSAGVSFEYSETEPVKEGDWEKVSLFLLANVPRPLEFAGRVVTSNSDFVSKHCFTLSPEQVNEVVESALDRLVFEHHRHEVVMRRANRE